MTRSFPQSVRVVLLWSFLGVTVFLPLRAFGDEAPPAPHATGKCMMWKVASKTATVYLVGSMHLSTPEMYPLPKEMEEAFAQSDILVVEVNIKKMDQAKVMQLIQAKGMYQGDQTLSGSIKKETWAQVQDACKDLGLPEAGVERMKPWLVGMTLEVLQIQKLGYDPKLGIDLHFMDLADEKNKPIEELESADYQVKLISSFDNNLQEQNLALTLAEGKNVKDDIKLMSTAWIDGDAAALDQQMNSKAKENPQAQEVTNKLIYDRNGPMAAKVEEYLKGTKTVFIVAGSAHMIGDKGIVKILQKDQFKVEQSPATKVAQTQPAQ